jgi:hypothetical protein
MKKLWRCFEMRKRLFAVGQICSHGKIRICRKPGVWLTTKWLFILNSRPAHGKISILSWASLELKTNRYFAVSQGSYREFASWLSAKRYFSARLTFGSRQSQELTAKSWFPVVCAGRSAFWEREKVIMLHLLPVGI